MRDGGLRLVFNVVASRQRKYEQRVLPMVRKFEERPQAATLAALAADGPGEGLGLSPGEPETIRLVAAGLDRYCSERSLDEDAGCRAWAEEQEPLRFAYRLDPYVGTVKGIGIALFAYMRMRSGAVALKPDLRVRKRLNTLGFRVPAGNDAAMVLIAEAAADELGITPFVLDQILW